MTRRQCTAVVVALVVVAVAAFAVASRPFDEGDTRCHPARTMLLLEERFVVRVCGDRAVRGYVVAGGVAVTALGAAAVVVVAYRRGRRTATP